MQLSHLLWGVWGLAETALGAAQDTKFDYLTYAVKRLQEYDETKKKLCGLSEPVVTCTAIPKV